MKTITTLRNSENVGPKKKTWRGGPDVFKQEKEEMGILSSSDPPKENWARSGKKQNKNIIHPVKVRSWCERLH